MVRTADPTVRDGVRRVSEIRRGPSSVGEAPPPSPRGRRDMIPGKEKSLRFGEESKAFESCYQDSLPFGRGSDGYLESGVRSRTFGVLPCWS